MIIRPIERPGRSWSTCRCEPCGRPATIERIIPQFFTADLRRTLAYFDSVLGFETQFEYGDPANCAGAIRDERPIFFRRVDEAFRWPANKYDAELIDAYIIVHDIEALFAEYAPSNAEFHREIAAMPWEFTEFVVKDIDGRLLCFGQFTELVES